uniref:Uncharacterized protein n=1 Tax=Rhizophora mucronata TaxID=61149 RepID=A0A2P2L607_RHIMU
MSIPKKKKKPIFIQIES